MPDKTIAQQVNLEASQKNIPLSIFIELTHECNMKCYYCYQRSFKKSRELELSQWKEILKQFKKAGALYITFSGGEPFLRCDFLEIISFAGKHDFALSIITNGLLINRDLANELKALNIMDIGVSLHAANEYLHDRLSGVPGSFQTALNSIRLLVAAGIKVLIKHSVSNANFGEYLKLQNLAESEGCAFECDSTILPMHFGEVSQYALSEEQHYTFLKEMHISPLSNCVIKSDLSVLHCDAGRSLCGIAPNGEVFPCIILPISLGNISATPFETIWHGDRAYQFRQKEEILDEACVNCSMNNACSRCHAVAYFETKQWRGKSKSLCNRAEAMTRLSGL